MLSAVSADLTESRPGERSPKVLDPPWFATASGWRSWIPLVPIAVVAAIVRVMSVKSAGGFRAVFFYDDGVYYSAANALAAGLVPYRDFLLVHPPGVMLIFAPFSWFAHLTSDSTAFAAARAAVIVVGMVNTSLIYIAARRLGMVAAVAASLLYAVWFPAVWVERTTLLEPFVLLGVTASLAVLSRAEPGVKRSVLAGILMGLAVGVKLWAAVPLLVFAGALVVWRHWRPLIGYVVAASVTATAVILPFVILAPSEFYRMVIADQATRVSGSVGPRERLSAILAAESFMRNPRLALVAPLVAAFAVMSVIVAVTRPAARLWVALLAVQVAVLLAVPVFFSGYASFAASGAVLVFGAFSQVVADWLKGMDDTLGTALRSALAAALIIGCVVVGIRVGDLRQGAGRMPEATRVAVKDSICVAADRPTTTIIQNRLTANLANHCQPVVDPGGLQYESGRRAGAPNGINRAEYQLLMQEYLAQADYVTLSRFTANGRSRNLSPETLEILQRRPLVARSPNGRLLVYGPPAAAR